MRREVLMALALVMSLLAVTAMPASASHGPVVVSNHTTDTDFNAGSVSNGMKVEGSGEDAVITVNGGENTTTFTHTGGEQTYTVPDHIENVTVRIWGAGGGDGSSNGVSSAGDPGGYVEGTLDVTPGETIYVYVGGQGGQGSGGGGFNGGADGGEVGSAAGGAGGGASDIRRDGNSLDNRTAVAGGGGGGGAAEGDTQDSGRGGAGGADTGESGQSASSGDFSNAGGGGGGDQSSGGSGGNSGGSEDGSLGQGGAGGTADDVADESAGGGGGGGYYGGGGGGADQTNNANGDDEGSAGGGGGGSNFDDGLTSVTANERATGNSGDGQVEISYNPGDPSATYISANHTVEGSVGGEVNITEIDNGSVTVTFEGWDGSTWTTLDQITGINTTGVHQFTWSEFTTSNTVRTNVTVFNESGTGGVQFTMSEEGVEADTSAPTVDNSSASPTGQLDSATPTLEINVNDSDFVKAHGDSVDDEFFVDGSSVGTDTLTSNGTASVTVSDALTGGNHTWHAVANDSYGHSTQSQTFDISTPGSLTFRDEQNASKIVDEVQVNITAYFSDQIIHRTSSNGEVDLSGFPVDEPIIVRVQAGGYYSRTVVIEDIFQQSDVYLLNDSVAAYQVRFDLQDPTGNYPRDDTVLLVDRDINQSGSVEWRTIAGDEFGVQGVPVDLQQDHRVRIRIKNLETGTTAILGKFTPIQDETVTLSPGSPQFEFGDIEREYTWEARQNDTSQKIIVEYAEENSSNTADVKITIHERFNTSNVLVDNQTFTDTNSLVFEQPLTNDQVNKTWSLVLYIDRGDGFMRFGPEAIGSGVQSLIPVELDEVWRTAIGVFVLLISSMAFSQLNRGVGAVVTSLVGGLLWYVGLLSLVATGPAVVTAIGISIAYQYRLGGRV